MIADQIFKTYVLRFFILRLRLCHKTPQNENQGADSLVLGTRKLWRMFPIKQKFNITVALFIKKNRYNRPINLIVHYAAYLHTRPVAQW